MKPAWRPETEHYDLGHPVYRITPAGEWIYYDNDVLVKDAPRPCPLCGQPRTTEGHDPCIADLPNVRSACCGHGVSEPYVTTYAIPRLAGGDALAFFRRHGKGPPK